LGRFPERRRSPRIEVSIELPDLGKAQNISADGMWVLVKSPLDIGVLLDLEFQLFSGAPLIKCKGEVIWVGHRKIAGGLTEAGLKFVDLAESDRKAVLEYVDSQYHH
jgi:hypothetical protein